MTKELAIEILQQQSEMETIRADYEPVWQQVADFCDPDGPTVNWSSRIGQSYDSGQASRADERARLVYDTTISSAADRLAAGLESLITPQSEKWHGLSTAAMNDEETDEEKEWAERLRDYIFDDIRYSAGSNFVPAIQACYLNIVRYGPAYLYSEEGFTGQLLRYASLPVPEVYLARDRWGEPDTFHRRYERPARVVAQIMGYENLPPRIQVLVDDPEKCMQKVSLIQCVKPRKDRRTYDMVGERVYLDSPFASYHVICEEEMVVKERSFQTFPIACFNWRRHEGDAYGISPTIKALTTVREINAVRRTGLRALQQITDPATASGSKVDDAPVLNPGQNYPGLIDDQGRMLIQPINTGQNPSYAFEYAGNRAEEIRDMLYVNLFQTLVQSPDMTATEALIRKEEKGELLGPSGSVVQRGFAQNLDRELSILEQKGIYAEDSRFMPPASLSGKTVHPTFTSPLDILRRAAEARDTIQVVTFAGNYAASSQDPSIMDNIDGDEALKIVQGAGRAPRRLLRKTDEVEAIRETRAKGQQAQTGAAAMAAMASAAKDGIPAAIQARDAGMMPQGAPAQ